MVLAHTGVLCCPSSCITFVQCCTNVEDVGPTLYKCYTNVLCLLEWLLSLALDEYAISIRIPIENFHS